MPRLTIEVDVSDDVAPTLVDPHDLAGNILEEYNISNRANGVDTQVALASAKWLDTTPCDTGIVHGPGHQSFSPCERTGRHATHETADHRFVWEDSDVLPHSLRTYGGRSYRTVSTGFFDDDFRR